MTRYDYLNDKELEKLEICKILHQCPWWRKYFPKKKYATKFYDGFTIHQSHSSGIGRNTEIECVCCGKIYDITDYSTW